jgi:predicted RNA methylase
MRFYENKYKFTPKEVRPFAQHTNTKENNPMYNEKLFEEEVKKVKEREEEEKR